MRIKLMLGHPSIWILSLIFLAAVIIAFNAPTQWIWLTIPVGIAAQFINEYLIHRFVFHQKPPKAQWAFDLLYQLHYGHHDFPSKPGLFFVPAWFAVPMLITNFIIAWGIFSLLGFAHAHYYAISTICIGGVGVFLIYEWFHMTAHTPGKKIAVEQYVTRLHGRHHFSNFQTLYHVSPGGVIIDKMLGTDYDPEQAKAMGRIEFMKTLNLRPDDERLINARKRFAEKYNITDSEVMEAQKL